MHVCDCVEYPRDVMPENLPDAVEWMNNKLVKAVGAAKLLTVKLTTVRHQEKLRSLAALQRALHVCSMAVSICM